VARRENCARAKDLVIELIVPRLKLDVLAFLRWAENPRDRVAGFRVIRSAAKERPTSSFSLNFELAALDSTDVPFVALSQSSQGALAQLSLQHHIVRRI
jgi:hypothetical protein